jgi:hypothetical protein
MRLRTMLVVLVCMAMVPGVAAQAGVISVKLTTDALGLGSTEVNKNKVVDPDVCGKIWTSTNVGEGSILNVQQTGLAGSGVAGDPLLVTITSATHLDTMTGLPAGNDYQAGVIYLTTENTSQPDGKDEGLGVRAFAVVGPTGLREIDAASGRPKIEGSKEVSGGTGPVAYEADPNGPPHVDESATFDFNPAVPVYADKTVVRLSKFELTDKIDLHILLASGTTFDFSFVGTENTSLFDAVDAGAKVWDVRFDGVSGIGPTDVLSSFTVRAIEDEPADPNPNGTAEHFLITGFTTDPVPEPASCALLVVGLLAFLVRRPRA